MGSDHIYQLFDGVRKWEMWLPQADVDHIQRFIASAGKPYEHALLQESKNWLNPGSVVVDAGGNVGNHSLFWALNGLTVHYFEPLEELVEIAKVNFELNHVENRVFIHQTAVGRENGRAMIARQDERNLGATMIADSSSGLINVIPIDSLKLGQLDCIKVDVEGYETSVLKGAEETISRCRPIIFSETINQQALEELAQFASTRDYVYWSTFNATPTQMLVPIENVVISKHVQNSLQQMKDIGEKAIKLDSTLKKLNAANLKYRNSTLVIQRLKEKLEKLR